MVIRAVRAIGSRCESCLKNSAVLVSSSINLSPVCPEGTLNKLGFHRITSL